tara:strand:- start:560 stop:880 length:321 start_codon:yes stop_codon:yes gene_type:complete
MPREVEPSLNERQFFAKALQENIRLDGRSFDQYRALELDFGDELGVVDVRLGKTRYDMLAFLFSRVFQLMPCGVCQVMYIQRQLHNQAQPLTNPSTEYTPTSPPKS